MKHPLAQLPAVTRWDAKLQYPDVLEEASPELWSSEL